MSTILYLLSLQDISKAPFRVVDEINQGMDPRNERNVHKLISDISTGESGSQYFLITPKLLRNLEYNEGFTVHVVFNGSGLDKR